MDSGEAPRVTSPESDGRGSGSSTGTAPIRFIPVEERDACLSIDSEGRIREWNAAAESLFGWGRDDALGREAAALLVEPSHRPGFAAAWEDFLGQGDGQPHSARLTIPGLRKDGSTLSLDITANRVPVPGGWKTSLDIRQAPDLAPLKPAERNLSDSTEQLYSIFNNINELLALVGVEGDEFRVLEANEYYLSHAFSPRERILGQLVSGYMPPPTYAVFAGLLRRVVETGQPVFREYQSGTMKGTPILELRLTPIRGSSGRVEKILVIGKDLTELRKIEESLRQSQKMEAVGRLAGGIAHDFNNLLTAINGFAEVAANTLGDPESAREMLEQIRLSGERAAVLTRQLLAFSRKQILLPKLIDLNAVLGGMKTLLLRLVRADIHLAFPLAPGLDPIRMDPGQLEQIILNLVINACDAMPGGGCLAVETLRAGPEELPDFANQAACPRGYVILQVTDSGIGMTPEIQTRIFEPYFTTKEPGKGTGMGLATVFGILNQSGGAIQVFSEPGKGSRFKVFFPAVESPADRGASPAAQAQASPEQTGQVVFLVEDEDPVREFAKQVLEGCGFRTLLARSGKDALEQLSRLQGPLHLLLTDLVMPSMNGPELWKVVKATHPETRVLFMSGYMDSEMIPKELLSADAPFLQKPFSAVNLVKKIKECLDQPDPRGMRPGRGPLTF